MFNLMAVVINKQMNKVFYCFDPNFCLLYTSDAADEL